MRSAGPLLLLLAGTAGFVWCYFNHICMAGHMCHSHKIQPWHYAAEAAWVGAWLGGALLGLVLSKPESRRRWTVCLIAVLGLLVFRFALGSLGGLIPGV